METFSALLALCVGNSPVADEFPSQRPVTRSFDVFFDLRLNTRLSKQSRRRWFEAAPHPLWRQCNVNNMMAEFVEIIPRRGWGYHGWWWPGDARGQSFSSHDVDLDFPEYSERSTRNVDPLAFDRNYCQTVNISSALVGNKTVDHSHVLRASPVGAAPTKPSFST